MIFKLLFVLLICLTVHTHSQIVHSDSIEIYQNHRQNLPNSQLDYCQEVIFEENDTISFVPTTCPEFIGHESYDHESYDHKIIQQRRHKRSLLNSIIPIIHIPYEPKESVSEHSYIAVQFRVCSAPGARIWVDDLGSGTTLSSFLNKGTSFQCNLWQSDQFESLISESSQIVITYLLPPFDDCNLSGSSIFLTNGNREGNRSLQCTDVITGIPVFELEIKYREVPFKVDEPEHLSPSTDTTVNGTHYRANWVKTYILGKRSLCDTAELVHNCQGKYFVGIAIEIERLDLDFDVGDYLVVGPGEEVDFWKNSKGHLIAHKIVEDDPHKHKIWINADSAFLRIVTHNSLIQDQREAIKFNWSPANQTLHDDLTFDPVSQMLKDASIKMCMAGGGCSPFLNLHLNFIEEVVSIFNRYITEHDKSITSLIEEDSVRIFDEEPIIYHRTQYSDEYCQFNLAISSPYDAEYPLVSSEVLTKMIFGNSNARQMMRHKMTFNNCVFQRVSWASILIPICTILLISTGMALIFRKLQIRTLHKQQKGSKKRKESLQPLHAKETNEIESAMQY